MNINSLDLRAYSLLLDERRKILSETFTAGAFDIVNEPTHRVVDFINKKIATLQVLHDDIKYIATKIRHIKEESNL